MRRTTGWEAPLIAEGLDLRWELAEPGGNVRNGLVKHLTPQGRPRGFTAGGGDFCLIP